MKKLAILTLLTIAISACASNQAHISGDRHSAAPVFDIPVDTYAM